MYVHNSFCVVVLTNLAKIQQWNVISRAAPRNHSIQPFCSDIILQYHLLQALQVQFYLKLCWMTNRISFSNIQHTILFRWQMKASISKIVHNSRLTQENRPERSKNCNTIHVFKTGTTSIPTVFQAVSVSILTSSLKLWVPALGAWNILGEELITNPVNFGESNSMEDLLIFSAPSNILIFDICRNVSPCELCVL